MSPRQHEVWDERLENWALWKHGVQGNGSVSDAYRSGGSWQWWLHPPAQPKPLVGEALDTDRLVRQLADEKQEALTVRYVWTYPETLEQRAAMLGISDRALRKRVAAAREDLENLHAERRRATEQRLAFVTRHIIGNVKFADI